MTQCKQINSQTEYDAAIATYEGECLHLVDAEIFEVTGEVKVSLYGVTKVTRVCGSATIQDVYGSAIIRDVYGSATIRIQGAARVVHATRYTVIHKTGDRCTVNSAGTVIEMPNLMGGDPHTWCDYYGLPVVDGHVEVFKAVNAALLSAHGMPYPIGETVTAPDWEPTADCGNGLHFSPSPRHTLSYVSDSTDLRFLVCRVALDGLVTLGDKVKAASCEVLHEVDRTGKPLVPAEAATP